MDFLAKYESLKKSIPAPAVIHDGFTQHCEMSDYMYKCNDCSYCFDCFQLERGIYCEVAWGKDLVDCQNVLFSELSYECINSRELYGSTYLVEAERCRDCHFCMLCVSCTDCFGCVGLTHKQYCIFNKQYTKEEYFKKIKELKKEDPLIVRARMQELAKTIPQPASIQVDTQNSEYGNSLSQTKDCYWCFNGDHMEHCGYVFTGGSTKHCWDLTFAGGEGKDGGMTFSYSLNHCFSCHNCAFLYQAANCHECYYSSYLDNCSDCFGCVGLRNKKYCILNNQLTKEQYEKTIIQLKKELGWRTHS